MVHGSTYGHRTLPRIFSNTSSYVTSDIPISGIREKLPSTGFGRYMGFAVLERNSLIQLLAECVLFPFIPLLCRMAFVGVSD
jgi:hypothetical protein